MSEHDESAQTFVDHLVELRNRLMRSVLAVLLVFIVAFPFANDIYHFLSLPVVNVLPEGGTMIATGVISPFLIPLKLTLIMSVFAVMPYIGYEAWSFVAPGLYRHEKRLVMPLLVSAGLLFYLGIVFAYYVVLPRVFEFMVAYGIEGVTHSPDITYYLDFMLKLFLAFGIAFEVPIATVLLVVSNVTTPQDLSAKRPYIIVGAFVMGMLLSPPDPMSQVLLAIPMWLLFEFGLIVSRVLYKRKKEAEDDEYKPLSEEEMEAELDKMDDDDVKR